MSDGGRSQQSAVSKKSFHFIAGLGSGLFTAVLLQPADLLKTRVQQRTSTSPSALQVKNPLVTVLREIAASPHPLRQLWRGTTPSALRTGAGSALYFGWLNALRIRLAERGLGTAKSASSSSLTPSSSSSALPKLSNTANLITGAIARAGAGFAMMPVTVIKVRYESSLYSYTTMWGASKDILRSEGLRGFFAGFGATAVRDAPYAGLYVLFYEAGKKEMGLAFSKIKDGQAADGSQSRLTTSTSAGINFASGVFAAVFATACTNPFDAIKTRLQLMPQRYGNMVKAAKMMLREEGIRSMFDGLALRIGRKAMSSALAWTVYEEIIRRAEVKLVEEKKLIS